MNHGISHILKQAGVKATSVRLAVLEQFSGDCKPWNAEKIFHKLKKAKTNLVTVYRTLALFETTGILRRVDLHKDSVYYELASHHHHHIVCTDCGTIESFEDCNMKNATRNALAQSSKFDSVSSHSLEFFGVCRKCSKI